jgi:hypothetical protein
MKNLSLSFVIYILSQDIFAQFSTKMEIMYSQNVQDNFEIYISTPPSFDSNTTYNAVYYCDANLKSGHFLRSFITDSPYNKNLDHTIFVGIGHIGNYHMLRRRDLTLPPINGADTFSRDKNYGQVEKFYSFIKDELSVTITHRFKINPDSNTIIGHSLGGLFVFFCLFRNDNLFSKYFALSPALWINNYSIYDFNKIHDGFSKEKHLYFVAGSKETMNRILRGTNEAKKFFDKKKYTNLIYEYKILDGQTHNSEVPFSLAEILNTKL